MIWSVPGSVKSSAKMFAGVHRFFGNNRKKTKQSNNQQIILDKKKRSQEY